MVFWLFKLEFFKFFWEMLKVKGVEGVEWDGVCNYFVCNNMWVMQIGDKGFFYYFNEGFEVVGIVEVCVLVYYDFIIDDLCWECVDICVVIDMLKLVSFKDVKVNLVLEKMLFVIFMWFFVQLVMEDEWLEVCCMGGFDNLLC